MAEVDVGEETYTVYADLDTADVYAGSAIHGDTWRDPETTEDMKGRALVTATRTLDRQSWRPEYSTFELRSVVPNIIVASIELAMALLDGSEVQNQPSGAERVRSISAGSVSITNFRGVDTPMRFPQIVQELLRGYLGEAGAGFVGKATGVDGLTVFPADLGLTGGL